MSHLDPIVPNALETLETRQMMSGGISLDDGVLTVAGLADEGNAATITVDDGAIHATLNGDEKAFSLASVKSIRVEGGEFADVLEVDAAVKLPVRLIGRGGDDRLVGGSGDDVFDGGIGRDTLVGAAGNDRFLRITAEDSVKGGTGKNSATIGEALGNTPASVGAVTSQGTAKIASLALVNTDTGKAVPGFETLSGTVTMNLASLPKNLSIRANVAGNATAVRFDLDGKTGFRTEEAAPYSLSGDMSGKLKPIGFSAGTHTVVASAVTSNGKVLNALGVTLKVVKANVGTTPTTPTTPNNPTTPTTPNNPTTPTNTNAGTPVAVIKAISSVVPAGTSVHVDALASQLKGGQWNEGTYVWDFGDAGSSQNTMRGFNAAHTYDKAGTYAVKLTVTNAAGKSDTVAMSVAVTAASRKVVYVSATGNDKNDGLTADSPIKTVAEALTRVDDNTEIRFRRGQSFATAASFVVKYDNVVIGAYGTGASPQIVWNGPAYDGEIFYVSQGTKNFTAQDLTINTVFDDNTDDSGVPTAFRPAGTNFTARRIEFKNVKNAFLMNLNPSGVLVQDCTSPLDTGLRKYFAWVQGDHITIAGNTVANSTREHIVRANFVSMLNVSDNELHNISRRETENDYWDYRKPALNIQSGEFAYAYNNVIDSSFQVGPLGQADGDKVMMTPAMRFKYAVGEGNTVLDEQMVVNHGAEHVTLRDNVVKNDDGLAITVDGYNKQYDREVVDLTIDNNTVVNNGTRGGFIHVYGEVDGIKLTDNLYVAPNLTIGEKETAAVKLEPDAYASFTEIDGNVWPVAAKVSGWVGESAMNYVGVSYTKAGMLTAGEWNGLSKVGTDTFTNVKMDDDFGITLSGARIGANRAA